MSYLPALFKYVDEHQDEYVQVDLTVYILFIKVSTKSTEHYDSNAWRLVCASNQYGSGTECSLIELVPFFNSSYKGHKMMMLAVKYLQSKPSKAQIRRRAEIQLDNNV